MGRVYKTFSARAGGRRVRGKALVDSGADRTVIDKRMACVIGLDTESAPLERARGFGGKVLYGYSLPVEVKIGKRKATVNAFVPSEGDARVIGHDFLQASKAKLNYARHGQEFSGLPHASLEVFPLRDKKMIAKLRRRTCPTPKRRRR